MRKRMGEKTMGAIMRLTSRSRFSSLREKERSRETEKEGRRYSVSVL
jgi:hypothetical protein